MSLFLGIDTSNYTTSLAVYDSASEVVVMQKKLLPTPEGALGLRQSDAVFAHVKQLSGLAEALFKEVQGEISGIGVSAFPRRMEGSYMPCFLVGEMVATTLSAVLSVPCHRFSHQEGHVVAALYSTGKLSLLKERFLAFHLSGGTTDALLVEPEGDFFRIQQVAGSLDLKAGQAVDRVGKMLGLPFPSGPALTELAVGCFDSIKVKPTLKGADCCLSGIQNHCEKLLAEGKPAEYIAKTCILFIQAALSGMTEVLLSEYGALPLVYAGGVMANSIIRAHMETQYGGFFAEPIYSADNSAGIALLAAIAEGVTV